MDDKYLEYFAAMVDELKKLNQKIDGLNQRVDDLNQKFDDLNRKVDNLSARVDKLEVEQQKTNALLSQHTIDLMKIIEILESDVIHFDKVLNAEIVESTGKKQRVIFSRPDGAKKQKVKK